MRSGGLLLAIVLVSAAMAGCIGGSDDDGEPVQKQRADVTEDLGGIQGVVTDDAVQPIAGANVTIRELGQTTETADDGSYAFSRLQPAGYTLVIEAPGFLSVQEDARVQAGEVTTLDVVVTHLQSEQPFTQTFELAGFIECGLGWETDPNPRPGLTSNAVAICSVPQGLPGGSNSTNDKFSHTLQLEAPVETVVYEISIPDQGGPASGTVLSLDMWIQGFVFDQEANLFDNVDAQDGHLIRLDRPTWEGVSTNFTENCQGTNDSEADDTYCGYNFWDEGWPLIIRAFADGSCLPTPASACAPIQQEFTHFVSAFYHEAAPEGYTLIGGA